MTRLVDLGIDPAQLADRVDKGLVRAKRHPTLPLTIYNYTEPCAYGRHWDEVTLQTRGLIVHDNGDVIARPFPKFFNSDEPGAAPVSDLDKVEVIDKVDGSLGILYGDAIATRGSFGSDQAGHATVLYRYRYQHRWRPWTWLTYLFEIVYPENRIVVDYRDQDDLILLGAVETCTGQVVGPDHHWCTTWPGPRAESLGTMLFAAAKGLPDRTGVEGVVVRVIDGPRAGNMVKLKQPDYVKLHRIVTGLNERVVWQAVCDGRDAVDELLAQLPEEFRTFVLDVVEDLNRACERIADEVLPAWLYARKVANGDRKTFAELAQRTSNPALMFALLDGKDIRPMVLKTLRPSADKTPALAAA